LGVRARDAQLPPPDLSWCWLFLGGRGASKSHSMSAAVHMAVRAGISRIHLIAPTDFHDVNLDDRSGILATCGHDPRPRWVSSKRAWNGPMAPASRSSAFSQEKITDSLRTSVDEGSATLCYGASPRDFRQPCPILSRTTPKPAYRLAS
jgi:phage terminase large subunit-like protein